MVLDLRKKGSGPHPRRDAAGNTARPRSWKTGSSPTARARRAEEEEADRWGDRDDGGARQARPQARQGRLDDDEAKRKGASDDAPALAGDRGKESSDRRAHPTKRKQQEQRSDQTHDREMAVNCQPLRKHFQTFILT